MIEFKVIKPNKTALEKQAWDALRKQTTDWLEGRLKDVECPTHHERPQVIVSGPTKKLHFEIKGCCQSLIDTATKALK